jgi:hypothetical protein
VERKGVSYVQSCHSMTGEKRLKRREIGDRLEVWGSLKNNNKWLLEDDSSWVEGKLLEVKLAANVVVEVRFKAGVVEKEPMTVAVAVDDMVRIFRIHTFSPRFCCDWVSSLFPRTVMIHSSYVWYCESHKLLNPRGHGGTVPTQFFIFYFSFR